MQKDAFLVFRALCKLSIKSASDLAVPDSTSIRGKVLALELVKILLENCGEVFSKGDKFILAIKQYLCLSLLKNSGSSIPQVLTLTCSIFFILLSKFRTSLKAEIAVFYPMIVLQHIEQQGQNQASSNGASTPNHSNSFSSFNHKVKYYTFISFFCDKFNSNLVL